MNAKKFGGTFRSGGNILYLDCGGSDRTVCASVKIHRIVAQGEFYFKLYHNKLDFKIF